MSQGHLLDYITIECIKTVCRIKFARNFLCIKNVQTLHFKQIQSVVIDADISLLYFFGIDMKCGNTLIDFCVNREKYAIINYYWSRQLELEKNWITIHAHNQMCGSYLKGFFSGWASGNFRKIFSSSTPQIFSVKCLLIRDYAGSLIQSIMLNSFIQPYLSYTPCVICDSLHVNIYFNWLQTREI